MPRTSSLQSCPPLPRTPGLSLSGRSRSAEQASGPLTLEAVHCLLADLLICEVDEGMMDGVLQPEMPMRQAGLRTLVTTPATL